MLALNSACLVPNHGHSRWVLKQARHGQVPAPTRDANEKTLTKTNWPLVFQLSAPRPGPKGWDVARTFGQQVEDNQITITWECTDNQFQVTWQSCFPMVQILCKFHTLGMQYLKSILFLIQELRFSNFESLFRFQHIKLKLYLKLILQYKLIISFYIRVF